MNKPNFIIREGVQDTREEYESFINDYNQGIRVKDLKKKYGSAPYSSFRTKALSEGKIKSRGKSHSKRPTGIKKVTITKRADGYVWTYYYKSHRSFSSKCLDELQKKVLEKGYEWIVIDSEQIERLKRAYNI